MALLMRPYLLYASRLQFYNQTVKLLVPISLSHRMLSDKKQIRTLESSAVLGPKINWGPLAFGRSHRRRISSRATTNVNDPGSIDSPMIQSMEQKIKEQLNAESVVVRDAYGDGRHVWIDVVSSAFEGQSAVNRQRMVYKAIWEELQTTVHAVDQMTTKTPSEAADGK